jgi:hypothetical protein
VLQYFNNLANHKWAALVVCGRFCVLAFPF